MGKHRRTEDLNSKPTDPKTPPETKAKEFDQQYNHNRKYTNSPNLDQQRKGK